MSKRRIYLDACIFIAIQRKDQALPADVLEAIHGLMAEIEQKKAVCVCSALMVTELLDGSYDILMKCFDGSKGFLVEVSPHLASEARKIRNKIMRNKATLEAADCVHIATALLYNCDCLVTIDGLGSAKHRILTAAAEIKKHFSLKVVSPIDAIDQKVMNLQPEEKEPPKP